MSSYTKYHKRYFKKFKNLLLEKNKKYFREKWYPKHREDVLLKQRLKREETARIKAEFTKQGLRVPPKSVI